MLDLIERKSRLVSLTYQVLGTIEPPAKEVKDSEVLALLAGAFHRRAAEIANAEMPAPAKPRGKRALPTELRYERMAHNA